MALTLKIFAGSVGIVTTFVSHEEVFLITYGLSTAWHSHSVFVAEEIRYRTETPITHWTFRANFPPHQSAWSHAYAGQSNFSSFAFVCDFFQPE